MNTPKIRTETDLISRLGCMRRNTVIENAAWGTIEHIELWVPAHIVPVPGQTLPPGSKSEPV